jgi:hypothetical protein
MKARIWFEWQPYPLQGRWRGIYSLGGEVAVWRRIPASSRRKVGDTGLYAGPAGAQPDETGPAPVVRRIARWCRPCTGWTGDSQSFHQGGRLLRRPRTETPARTNFRLGPDACTGQAGVVPDATGCTPDQVSLLQTSRSPYELLAKCLAHMSSRIWKRK